MITYKLTIPVLNFPLSPQTVPMLPSLATQCDTTHSRLLTSTLLRHIPATGLTLLLPQIVVPSTGINLHVDSQKTSKRGVSVLTRAGSISASSYIFAFVFPISLLAVTILTSIRIADKIDQKFFEELAVNEAIMEADEDEVETDIFRQRTCFNSHPESS